MVCVTCKKQTDKENSTALSKFHYRCIDCQTKVDAGYKKCTTCKEFKLSSSFSTKLSTCKECKIAYSSAYFEKNKEVVLNKMKDYREGHGREVILSYRTRPDLLDKRRSDINSYYKQRKQKDPSFKCLSNLRIRQWHVTKGSSSTTEGLGCNSEELRKYLESLWVVGMSWDNYGHGKGKWVVDHIKPLESHHKTETGDWDPNSDYNKQLMHYTNLQPLWFEDNAKKGSNIT